MLVLPISPKWSAQFARIRVTQASLTNYSVENAMESIHQATDEGVILQIDLQDLEEAQKLFGHCPTSFSVVGKVTGEIIDACRHEFVRIMKRPVAAAVVVVSGGGEILQLQNCTAIFDVFRQAVDESVYLVFGVVCDKSLANSMRVTCLAGWPDS